MQGVGYILGYLREQHFKTALDRVCHPILLSKNVLWIKEMMDVVVASAPSPEDRETCHAYRAAELADYPVWKTVLSFYTVQELYQLAPVLINILITRATDNVVEDIDDVDNRIVCIQWLHNQLHLDQLERESSQNKDKTKKEKEAWQDYTQFPPLFQKRWFLAKPLVIKNPMQMQQKFLRNTKKRPRPPSS